MMEIITTPLVAAIVAWAAAQLLKVAINSIMERRFAWYSLLASGGMPSSHSAFVTALAFLIGVKHGFSSDFFSLAAAFALVVMYDACGVRRAVGEQAKALNRILDAMKENSTMHNEAALKEILGHSPFQVAMGFLLGIGIGLVFMVG
ncbi:MAG: divergent PAP2 family protein [Clostridia bacterium]